MDRLFSDLFGSPPTSVSESSRTWYLPVDIIDQGNAFQVKAAVPGSRRGGGRLDVFCVDVAGQLNAPGVTADVELTAQVVAPLGLGLLQALSRDA